MLCQVLFDLSNVRYKLRVRRDMNTLKWPQTQSQGCHGDEARNRAHPRTSYLSFAGFQKVITKGIKSVRFRKRSAVHHIGYPPATAAITAVPEFIRLHVLSYPY